MADPEFTARGVRGDERLRSPTRAGQVRIGDGGGDVPGGHGNRVDSPGGHGGGTALPGDHGAGAESAPARAARAVRRRSAAGGRIPACPGGERHVPSSDG
ncbi:hypothetical protein [Streptomyces fumanus]|uniref:hypothetical protein n=1 Tax=Streptomyces fumanus TaxID=67302 RepID=UPI00167E3F9B|nr:hypothetical protein [Streptomyces fumanus]